MTTLMWDDRREVKSVSVAELQAAYLVGACGVTKIVPYKERGQTDFVPYFAIYKGESIIARLPAFNAMVTYDQ